MENKAKLIVGSAKSGRADIILGLQYGDEGKGKIVDTIASDYDYVVRFQGGANSGHTIWRGSESVVTRILPSGVFDESVGLVIGKGVVIDPVVLVSELKQDIFKGVELEGRLLIDDRCHMTLPIHKTLDELWEKRRGGEAIGSTKRGNTPTYASKSLRVGVTAGELENARRAGKLELMKVAKQAQNRIAEMFGIDADDTLTEVGEFCEAFDYMYKTGLVEPDVSERLVSELMDGKSVLLEGAQGVELSLSGESYPNVTSSEISVASAFEGSGIPVRFSGKIIGITKAYSTRVGAGIFSSEIHGGVGDEIIEAGGEYGSVTGRKRRVGWIDVEELHRACSRNSVTDLIVTKADVLFGIGQVSVYLSKKDGALEFDGFESIEDDAFKSFIDTIGTSVATSGAKICLVSHGTDRKAIMRWGVNSKAASIGTVKLGASIASGSNGIKEMANPEIVTLVGIRVFSGERAVVITKTGWSDKYSAVEEDGEFGTSQHELLSGSDILDKFGVDVSEYFKS